MAILKSVAAGQLPNLRGLLQEWVDWVGRYCADREKPDAPYWHNEQTNTSTLVNVIGKIGGWALMEMTEEGRPSSNKRVDLWFMLPDSGAEFLVEAKRPEWWWYEDPEEWLDVAGRSLDTACGQIRGYDFSSQYVRLGAVFVVPMVREGTDVAGHVRDLVSQFEEWDGCDASAWYLDESPPRHLTLREGK